ncbi:hypothetical protein DITRI_Ditri13aG0104100 [Diplodiscus trichospermus]
MMNFGYSQNSRSFADWEANLFTVFIDKLSKRVLRMALWELFNMYGKVVDVFISFKAKQGRTTYAFVRYKLESEMQNFGNAKSEKDSTRPRTNHAKASIFRDSQFYKEVFISPNPKEGPHSVGKCIRQEMLDPLKENPPSNGGGGAVNNTNIEKQAVLMQNKKPNDTGLKSFVVYNHAIFDSDLEYS